MGALELMLGAADEARGGEGRGKNNTKRRDERSGWSDWEEMDIK